ncbi:MAG: universal stress protein [Opitutaceae bacterium]|nr:universal stress protein [Opitutaceae bacterium]
MTRVLLCTDGSAYSQVCCQYAAWLAGRVACEFEVLYVSDLRQFEVPMVADLSGSLGVQPYQAVLAKLQELEVEKAKLVLQDAARLLAEVPAGTPTVFTHRTGFIVDCFHEYERTADFVMLGKRGENANFATGHLGSTMERVVRASHQPCFVTSRSFAPIERLLLAYDGGRSCRKALQYLTESKTFRGLEVHVVIVSPRAGEEASLGYLREAETALSAAGFSPHCQMLHGVTEDEIAAYVAAHGINCLIMGAYGHTRIRQFVIGSTTTAMMRQCRVPVLLFR